MRSSKGYKHQKRRGHGGRHVQLYEWFQACPAWATLSPGPRALYVELKRRFNGTNNGRIVLSHRDAAKALNVHCNTVGAWFDELVARGFIHMMQGPCLGPSGIGQSAHWALDEEPTDDLKPARKAFMRWTPEPTQAREPRTKTVHGRHNGCDAAPKVGPNTGMPS